MNAVILGVSHWHAHMHAQALMDAGANLAGVSDEDPACLNSFAQHYDAPGFASHRQMLRTVQPDFAVVLGTPLQMPQYTQELMDAGIPMLVEKPLSPTAQEVARLMAQAAKTSAYVAVAMANRLSGMWAALQGHQPLQMHFRMINGSPQRYVQNGVEWVLNPAVSGGGALRNLGIHGVDAFCKMAQHQPVEVLSALLSRTMHQQAVEDHALLSLRAGELWGTVEVGYTYPTMAAGGEYSFKVVTGGWWLQEFDGPALQATTYQHQSQLPTVPLTQRYNALMQDTLNRWQLGLPPLAGLGDLFQAMQVIDRAYQQAQWV